MQQSTNMRVVANLLLLIVGFASSLQMSPTKGTKDYAWLREAEKKHSRVALLALPTLAAISIVTGEDPVPWLNSQPASDQIAVYSVAAMLESVNLRRMDKGFTLKDGEEPGKILPVTNVPDGLDGLEDALGRVAMLMATSALIGSALA